MSRQSASARSGALRLAAWMAGLSTLIGSAVLAPDARAQEGDGGEEPAYGAVAVVESEEHEDPEPGAVELEDVETREVAGAFGDPFRVLEALPGTAPLRNGSPYVYVRGAPPAGTVYYYDGIALPSIAHLGAGPPILHPGVLDDVRFFPGAAPARYGRHTGGVFASSARGPTPRASGEAELRLLDATAMLRAPVGDGHATLAGRYGYPGLLVTALSQDTTLAYWDYLARYSHPLGGDDRVELVWLGSFDSVENPPWVSIQTPRADMSLEFHRLELRLVRERRRWELGAALGLGYDDSTFGTALEVNAFRLGPRLWLALRGDDVHLRLGGDLVGAAGRIDDPSGALLGPDGSIEVDLPLYADVPGRSTGGLYAEAVIQPDGPLAVHAGLRTDVWIAAGNEAQAAISPRLRLSLTVAEPLTLHVGAGLAHQPAVYMLPLPGLTDTAIDRGLQRAIQTDVGARLDLPGSAAVELTAFAHHYSDILTPDSLWGWRREDCDVTRPPPGPPCETSQAPPRATALSYGVETLLKRESAERVSGWIAYTLAWARAWDDEGFAFAPRFDVRHVLSLVSTIRLGAGFQIGGRATYRSGGMATEIRWTGLTLETMEQRLPSFFRADVRLGYGWDTSWGRLLVFGEWLNVTLSREPIDIDCFRVAADEACRVVFAPEIFFPNAGVRASF